MTETNRIFVRQGVPTRVGYRGNLFVFGTCGADPDVGSILLSVSHDGNEERCEARGGGRLDLLGHTWEVSSIDLGAERLILTRVEGS